MTSKTVSRVSPFALLAVVAPLAIATPVAAQFVQPLPNPDGPVARLGGYMRILATNPRNLDALLGAGTAALDVGDANAALGFFSRAEEISPSSGRAKAGLGAALANIEKPNDALRLFAQAASLGAREAEFARDRGLAYDLTGDWRRAQRDYALALQVKADDETVRRLALSLGISGDRAGALKVLDPLLRRQDQGAWRARSFIYAMTGDVAQANTVARQLMPAPMAASMSPLLSRLATLNPAERAHAVNFGTVPSDGTRLASADTSRALPAVAAQAQAPTLAAALASRGLPRATPSSGLIPAGEPLGRRSATSADAAGPAARQPVQLALRTSLPVTPAASRIRVLPRSDPLDGSPFSAATVRRRVIERIGPVDPARLPPAALGAPTTVTRVTTASLPPPTETATTMTTTTTTPRADAALAQVASVAVLPRTALPTPGASTPVVTAPVVAAPTQEVRLATTVLPPATAPTVPRVSTPIITIDPNPAPLVRPATTPPSPPSTLVAGATQPVTSAPEAMGPPAAADAAPLAAPAVETSTPGAAPVTPAFETPAPGFTQPIAAPVVAADPATMPTPGAAGARLAGLLQGITTEQESVGVELPPARELRLAQLAAKRKAAEQAAQAAAKAEAERAAKAEAARIAQAALRNPARLWVQVASGADEAGLPLTWRRVHDGNEAALAGLAAYSMRYKATNRLLVGPLKSPAAAQALIGALGRNGVAAMAYNSDAGQEVALIADR